MIDEASTAPVTVVIVTYADRWILVRETLRRAFAAGGDHAVVVVNRYSGGALEKLMSAVNEWHERVRVVVSGVNHGSAWGYREGLRAALRTDAELVWLLDDDNHPEPGSLAALRNTVAVGTESAPVVGLSYRPHLGPQHRVVAGANVGDVYPRPGTAVNFNLLDRLRQRLRGSEASAEQIAGAVVAVPLAPWGGLLLPRAIVEQHGLPLAELVLYADDYEYADRLVAGGVRILLDPTSVVLDADIKDGAPVQYIQRGIVRLLRTPARNHTKLYYQLRNDVYLDRRRAARAAKSWEWAVNLGIFVLAVRGFAALDRRNRSADQIVMRAIRDGLAGRLGEQYPLV